jgi:hypothetical protein
MSSRQIRSALCLLLAALLRAAAAEASDPAAGMQRIGKLTLSNDLYRSLYNAVIDPAGFAYFSTAAAENPGWIIKVDLRGPLPMEVGAIHVQPGELNLLAGAIDPAAGYAYFGSLGSPGRVIKIALGQGSAPPVYVGSIGLAAGENNVFAMVIDANDPDPAKHYLYVATNTAPGRVVKVAAGAGGDLPSRVGAVQLAAGEDGPRRGVIDPAHGYAYFATIQSLVKIALGAGNAPPQRVGAAPLDATETGIGSAVIDLARGYVYLGTASPQIVPAKVVKVRLETGNAAPTRLGALTLGPGERELATGVIDPAGGFAFFGSDHTHPAKIYKVSLGAGDALPTEVGVLQLAPGSLGTGVYPPDGGNISAADASLYGEIYLRSSVIDLAGGVGGVGGYAYWGTDTVPAQVVKVALGDPPAATDYFTLVPCRALDTRNPAGPQGGPALAAGGQRIFMLTEVCSIPTTARAVAVNVTVVGPPAAGDLRFFPGDGAVSMASTINFGPGQVRANNAVLPLAFSGAGTVGVRNDAAGTVDLVVDVVGYFQ